MKHRPVAVFVVCLAAIPAGAWATITKDDSHGDVKARNLTTAQRKAIDIVHLRAIGHRKVGTLVIVTFAGNFDAEVGHGMLQYATATTTFDPDAGEVFLYTTGRRGKARAPQTFRDDAGASAVVRRGHTIRFWLASEFFGDFSRMQTSTGAGRASIGVAADVLRSKVARSRNGCATARDLLEKARSERRDGLASANDTRKMRNAMLRVTKVFENRRDSQCDA